MSDAPLTTVVRQLHKLAATPCTPGETDRDLLQRFTAAQDGQAFEALVRRHGRLVLGVCRRVLHQEQDAEDAFQATFLFLAKKAASIRDAGTVVSWLYGAAYRTALAAKRAAGRRRTHEARATAAPPTDPSWEVAWREVQTVLDDEIDRLPRRLRGPFLLCHLEGQGRADAARQLGLTEGTVWSRLAQARKLLRDRLARRGITLSAVLGAAGVTVNAEAAVPAALRIATTKAAEAVARGGVPDVSANVAALVQGGARTMARLKLGVLLAITVGLLAVGAAVLARPGPTPDPAAGIVPPAQEGEKPAATDRHGDPLPSGALARMGTVRLRHKESGTAVTFTPDGRQLVSAAGDGSVRFWDLAGGKELLTIRAAEFSVAALALTADGKVLATADGKTVWLWDAKTGRELRQIPSESDVHNPGPLVFTADGATLAAVANDASIRLYQTATGKQTLSLPAQGKGVRCLAFTADGKNLVSVGEGSADGPLCVWDLASGQLTRKVAITSPGDTRIRPLTLSPDGRTLAVECVTTERVKQPGGGMVVFSQYRLCLWDVADGKERLRTDGERDVLWAAAFSADGKSVATAGMGDHVRIWDAKTGEQRVALKSHPGGSRPDASSTVAFSPDGTRLATVGEGAAVQVWDLTAGGELAGLPEGHRSAVSTLAYAPDGRTLVSAGDDHTIRLWDAATGRPQRLLTGHTAGVRAIAYAPDGRAIASADRHGALMLWDLATGKPLRTIQAVPRTSGLYAGLCPLAFTPDGKHLASWGDDRRFRRWDLSTGKEIVCRSLVLTRVPPMPEGRPETATPAEAQIASVRIGPDCRTAALSIADAIHLVDVVTGQELFKLPGHHGPSSLAFSPDGRTLASGGWDKTVRLWDVTTGQELLRVEGLDTVNAVAVAPDGRTVTAAMGWGNGEVRLLDARTGEALLRLKGHASYASALTYSPDGKTLASGQRDTSALVWDLTPGLRRLAVPARTLSRAELQAHWSELAGADARKGRAAALALTSAPGATLPFLKDRLRPAERAKAESIQRRIADLDSTEFAVRESATKELAVLGVEAEPALRLALKSDLSAEAKRRVETLLEGPAPREAPSGELLQRLRAIHVLEQVGSVEAIQLLQELAGGAPSARETIDARNAVERLTQGAPRP